MAVELVWRPKALEQLEAIADYIRQDSPRAAASYIATVIDACDRLADFPRSGRIFQGGYRAIVVGNHLVIYRHDDENSKVILVAVLDGRRDLKVLLKTFGDEPETY